jgi:hypothetical protein
MGLCEDTGAVSLGRAKVIEQALYFAIGFLAASLAAIAALPVVSRRAMRLSERRARLQAPTTEKQAIAERDALRAQYAVEQARLERRSGLAEEAAIRLRAEVGRQSVKVIAQDAELKQRLSVSSEQRSEIDRLAAERRDLDGALGASQIALHDVFAQRDRAQDAEAAALARQNALEAEASRDRARIAILVARAESLEGRNGDLSHAARAATDKAEAARTALAQALAAESARARNLERRLRDASSEKENLSGTSSTIEANQDASRTQIRDLESRLAASERITEETLLENGRQLAVIADREAALKEALAKAEGLEARLPTTAARTRAKGAAAVQREQSLSTAQTTTKGSARAARPNDEALRRENAALRGKIAALTAVAGAAAEDAALRETIKRLGREVGQLFSAQAAARREDPGAANRFAFDPAALGALAEPSSGERHGLADSSGRRIARSHAPDR